MHIWLNEPHVFEWWGNDGTTEDDIEKRYLPMVLGTDFTKGFIIMYESKPIGFIQVYKLNDYPEWEHHLNMKDNVAGIDIFIGEKEFVGKGLGTKIIKKFVDEIVFTSYDVIACIADPSEKNIASVKAFQNAGFSYLKNSHDPETGDKEIVLQLKKH